MSEPYCRCFVNPGALHSNPSCPVLRGAVDRPVARQPASEDECVMCDVYRREIAQLTEQIQGRQSASEPASEALAFCDEIEQNERELIESGWGGYQWEHLGDATKDIHRLIRYVRELAALAAARGEERPNA